MKRKIITLLIVAGVIFGSVWFWKYSGANDVTQYRQEMIKAGAIEYTGKTTVTFDQYEQLKVDLVGNKDYSLSIIETYPKNDAVEISYYFLSTKEYPYLSHRPISKETWTATYILPIIFGLVVILWAMKFFLWRELRISKANDRG